MAKRNRKSIEERYMGPEPIWDKANPCPPLDDPDRNTEWSKGSHWYNYFNKSKDHIPIILKYAKEELGYSKLDIQSLKKLPPWKIGMAVGSWCRLFYRGWIYPDDLIERTNVKFAKFLEQGNKLKKVDDKEQKTLAPIISPIERTRRKMYNTIYVDWDTMVLDNWMDDKFDKLKFPVYNLFKYHDLKGSAINMFRDVVQKEYDLISDAYHKKEEQAVEAYEHIKKGDKQKMLKLMETIFEDIDKLKTSARVTRATRVKKYKTSDKQVERLNYKKEDIDAKLASINPVRIPSSNRLYVYNTKQRKLIEYVSNSTKGFEVKGSTLYNWDEELSRITTLRKPDEVLPQILNKTERQITTLWKSFTTKTSVPKGRINKDCILLRVE